MVESQEQFLLNDEQIDEDFNQKPQNQQKGINIICCVCGLSFNPSMTKTNICLNCLTQNENIDQNIQKEAVINFCRNCRRYQGNQWLYCERESKELLTMCLKKLKNLNQVKLIDTKFIWTEPHSKRIKIKIQVQKEVQNAHMNQQFVAIITENYVQCPDCKKEYTPHTWNSKIQLRQFASHKKTFFFIEQLIIKHKAQNKVLRVQEVENGLDFFYKIKQDAIKFVDFIQKYVAVFQQNKKFEKFLSLILEIVTYVPTKINQSSKLISANEQNNTSNTQYTWSIEIPKICKDDMVIIPQKLCKELGGVGRILLCTSVSSQIHFVDPHTLKRVDMSSEKYFQNEEQIQIITLRNSSEEFLVMDCEKIHNENLNESFLSSVTNHFIDRIMRVTVIYIFRKFICFIKVSRTSDWAQFTVKTHLGNLSKLGNTLLGYDLSIINDPTLDKIQNKPEIILVKKIQSEKSEKSNKERIWKLKKLPIEQMQNEQKKPKKQLQKLENQRELDEQEFLLDIETNKEYRKNMNLFKNNKVASQIDKKEKSEQKDKNDIQIDELLDDISEKNVDLPDEEEEEIYQYANLIKNQNNEGFNIYASIYLYMVE